MASGKTIVIGSINLDVAFDVPRFPEPGETVSGSCLVRSGGGKGANQAYAAARLGGSVTLVAGVGDDEEGKLLLADATREGIDTQGCTVVAGESTGRAFIERDAGGENRIVVIPGANAGLIPARVDAALFAGKAVASFVLEIPLQTVRWGLTQAKKHGAVTVLNPSPFTPEILNLLQWVDVIVANQAESEQLRELCGADMGRLILEHRLSAVITTMGADGATLYSGSGSHRVPGIQTRAIDTTGCGDGFTGAFAHSLAEGVPLAEAGRIATAVGAYAAGVIGAQDSYPTLDELREWLRHHPSRPGNELN